MKFLQWKQCLELWKKEILLESQQLLFTQLLQHLAHGLSERQLILVKLIAEVGPTLKWQQRFYTNSYSESTQHLL